MIVSIRGKKIDNLVTLLMTVARKKNFHQLIVFQQNWKCAINIAKLKTESLRLQKCNIYIHNAVTLFKIHLSKQLINLIISDGLDYESEFDQENVKHCIEVKESVEIYNICTANEANRHKQRPSKFWYQRSSRISDIKIPELRIFRMHRIEQAL